MPTSHRRFFERNWCNHREVISNIDTKHKDVHIDKYAIMPNHVHLIIALKNGAMWASPPTDEMPATSLPTDGIVAASLPSDASIPRIVRSLKTLVAKESGAPVFQKSYHDHIIRHEAVYHAKWNYIDANPFKWVDDEYCIAMNPI